MPIAICHIVSWQTSPRCFPYTIAARVKLHAMRDTAVGVRFAYIGQVSWDYTTPGSRPASKALPYQTPRQRGHYRGTSYPPEGLPSSSHPQTPPSQQLGLQSLPRTPDKIHCLLGISFKILQAILQVVKFQKLFLKHILQLFAHCDLSSLGQGTILYYVRLHYINESRSTYYAHLK